MAHCYGKAETMIRMMDEMQRYKELLTGGVVSPREQEELDRFVDVSQKIINWFEDQAGQITNASYDKDTGELVFDMKNTSGIHFRRLRFMMNLEGSTYPIIVEDWADGEIKKIQVTHFLKSLDFPNLTMDVQTIAYELYEESDEEDTEEMPEDTVKEQDGSRMEQARNEVLLQCAIAPGSAPPTKDDMEAYLQYMGYNKEEIDYALSLMDSEGFDIAREIHLKGRLLWHLSRKIEDKKMAKQVKDLGDVSMDISQRIGGRPDQAKKVNRFREYYLPTLIKNLERFEEIEENNSEGKNFPQMKQSMKEMLAACQTAFQSIKDNLYDDDVLEADVDNTVMKQLLSMDGLLEE